jgi:uncharacterized membrane protein YgcG
VKRTGNWFFRRDDLHLKLLVDRSEFTDYEKTLVTALFGSSDTTDTESLKKRYRSTGFDPASKIRGGVESKLKQIRGFAKGSPKPRWEPTGLLLAAAFAILVAAFVVSPAQRGMVPGILIGFTLVWVVFGLIPAMVGQGRLRSIVGACVWIAIGLAVYAFAIWGIAGQSGVSWLHVAGALLWATGLTRATFNLLATRESAESLARRRELQRARAWFEAELGKAAPQLEDRWFPYLLAFGLAPDVDRWFRRFGGESTSSFAPGGSGGRIGGGGSIGGGGWTGGGGSFGGAGASASWALAATAMSAGVPSPSSGGSGGGGGGGGGGSAGGGGGGGW